MEHGMEAREMWAHYEDIVPNYWGTTWKSTGKRKRNRHIKGYMGT